MYDESIFHGVKDIKYLLEVNKESKKLMIIFSTYCIEGKENKFTYVEEFKEINCNKLYIKDDYGYEGRGCWYLGEKGRLSIENSVIRLILSIIKTLKIGRNDILLLGFENGGFASLYYGLKYKFKNIVSITPQILLGDYLQDKSEVLEAILGNQNAKEINILNNLIYKLVPEEDVNIYLYCGNEDEHGEDEIRKFINNFRNLKNIQLEIYGGNCERVKEEFLKESKNIIECIFKEEYINDEILSEEKISDNLSIKNIEPKMVQDRIEVKLKGNKLITKINIFNIKHEYACYLKIGNEVVQKQFYKKYPEFEFDIKEIDDYRVMWYIKDCIGSRLVIEMAVGIQVDFNGESKITII